MNNIYPYPWPIGTCHVNDLPTDIRLHLQHLTVDGVLDESLTVHRTATEGAYISFAGWKVRAVVEVTSPTTYIVRLA